MGEQKNCTCGKKWEKEDVLLVTYFFLNVSSYDGGCYGLMMGETLKFTFTNYLQGGKGIIN